MQPHSSSALRYASAAQAVHSRVYGGCTAEAMAEAAASEASGPRVSGCIRDPRNFRANPVSVAVRGPGRPKAKPTGSCGHFGRHTHRLNTPAPRSSVAA